MHLIACITKDSIQTFLETTDDKLDKCTLYLKINELSSTELESIRDHARKMNLSKDCEYYSINHRLPAEKLFQLSGEYSNDDSIRLMNGAGNVVDKGDTYLYTILRVFGLWDSEMSPYLTILHNKTKHMNPTFRTIMYDENRFLKEFSDYNYIQKTMAKHPICKADIYRYIILYQKGGFYLDMDIDNYASVAPLIDDKKHDVVLFVEFNLSDPANLGPRENPTNLTRIHNCMMWSKPGHPFFKDCIQIAKARYSELVDNNVQFTREDVLWCTGPDVVTSLWYDKYKNDSKIKVVTIQEKNKYFKHLAHNSWL